MARKGNALPESGDQPQVVTSARSSVAWGICTVSELRNSNLRSLGIGEFTRHLRPDILAAKPNPPRSQGVPRTNAVTLTVQHLDHAR